ncbi:MAG: glycosyltransferase family 4 protein [Desulfobacterales bacterium]|jgi:glycosyltransferase involved in cell wall biosynthesis
MGKPPIVTVSARPVLGMVLKGYPRISETFISNEILLLEQLGFTVHIFSMRSPRENFAHRSIRHIRARVDYLPETLLMPLPRFLYHNLLLARQNPRVYLETLKIALRRFRRTRRLATFKHFLQAGYLVQRLLPGSGVRHLHAHFAHSPASVALFSARLSGLSFSFTAHAKDIYTSDQAQLVEKLVLAKFVVTCTEYNCRHLKNLTDGDGAPIYRVYHGIDTDLFSRPAAARTATSPYSLLTVARITAKKGLQTVYHSVRWLCDNGYDVRHTLIGDGEDREKTLALIDRLALTGVARWCGTQPHEVVLDHYRQADVFVLGCEVAANGDRDGIPNVLLESMAMGVPVVATSVSAIPELVQDGETGLLVPPRDPEKLARAVVRLLTDTRLREEIVAKARERVIRYFDNRQHIRQLVEIYRCEIPALGKT